MWRKVLMVWVLLTAIVPLLIQAYPLNRVPVNFAGPVDFVIIGIYIPTDGYWYFTDSVSPLYSLSYSAPTGVYVVDWADTQTPLLHWRFIVHSQTQTTIKVVVVYFEGVNHDWGRLGFIQDAFEHAFADYLNGQDFSTRLNTYLSNPPAEVCYLVTGPKGNPIGCFPVNMAGVKVTNVMVKTYTVAPDKTLDMSEVTGRDKLDPNGWRYAGGVQTGFTPTYSYVVINVYQNGPLNIALDYPYYSPAIGVPEEAVKNMIPWWLLALAGLVTTLLYYIYKNPKVVTV
ncbi:MAG: hypothetical protein QW212_04090 [Nitrososphaerales archaeon]